MSKWNLFFISLIIFCIDVHAVSDINIRKAAKKFHVIPNIIVKALKAELSAAGGSKRNIFHSTFQVHSVKDISETLNYIAGLSLHDLTGTNNQLLVNMRGFGTNASGNTLFLIDDIPYTNPDLAPPDLNLIPISDLKQIEIINGSEGVLYGDRAVGGVINLESISMHQDSATMACRTGSYQLKNCELKFAKQKNSINLKTSLYALQTDNYRAHNDYHQWLWTINFNQYANTLPFNINYRLSQETVSFPGALTHEQVIQNRQQASNHTDYFQDQNNLLTGALEKIFGNLKFKTSFLFRKMEGFGVLFSPFNQSRSVFFIKPQIKKYFDQSYLNLGIDLEKNDYQLTSAFGLTNNSQQKFSPFIFLKIPIQKMIVNLGARFAIQQNFLDFFEPTFNKAFISTIGISRQFDHVEAYIRRAGSYRFPNADELAEVANSNSNLQTQIGYSYETGFNYQVQHSLYTVNLYQLMLDHEIAFNPLQTALHPFGSNQNLPPTIRNGFSIQIAQDIVDKFAITTKYDYVKAHFQHGLFSGKRIPLVPMHVLNLNIIYRLNDAWTIVLETLFTGNEYAANDNANISKLNGGYTIFNLNLRYAFKYFSAAFRVNNISNKNYYSYTVFQPSQNQEFYYPAPGRNFTLNFNYDFW